LIKTTFFLLKKIKNYEYINKIIFFVTLLTLKKIIMEEQNTSQQTPLQIAVPGAILAFVFGIISVCTFWLGVYAIVPGLIPLVFGIIAMIKGGKAAKIYKENPSIYLKAHSVFATVGKITGLVGWILTIVFMLIFIIGLLFIGSHMF
jgi:uncharacterized membrane protein